MPDIDRRPYDDGNLQTALIEEFRMNNPELSLEIGNDEILKRHIPTNPPRGISVADECLVWIPQYDVIIEESDQYQRLDRIWDGRQTHCIDHWDDVDAEYEYGIDFGKRILHFTVWGSTMLVPFSKLRVGLLEDLEDAADSMVRARESLDGHEIMRNVEFAEWSQLKSGVFAPHQTAWLIRQKGHISLYMSGDYMWNERAD
jgi:hypothetical protein